MTKIGFYVNNLEDVAVFPSQNNRKIPLARINGYLFMIWGADSLNYLTKQELRRAYQQFGHPSVDRLIRLIKKAGHDDPEHRQILEKINEFCEFCQKHSRAPGRFKFMLKDEDNAMFNYIVYVNIMHLNEKDKGELVLYIINTTMSF